MINDIKISPRSGNKPKNLVVFLHGVGADGQNISDICNVLNRCIDDTFFLCPNAPFRYDMADFGYQWFSLMDRKESVLLDGINKCLPILNDYIDENLEMLELSDSNLAIMGFSQGCMMALHAGLRRKNSPGCIIGFSGSLVGSEWLKNQSLNKPPIILSHGMEDEVVEPHKMQHACDALSAMGINVDSEMIPHLPHAMNEQSINIAVNNLKKHLDS